MSEADRYQVLEELGHGSFGVVYKGIDKVTGETVAIKHVDLEASDEDLRELQAEITVLSSCSCPRVTQYLASFVKGAKLWIIMEFLGGGSCLDLLKPGPFNEAHTAIIMREILLGLDYLHQTGKIHRDIKGANILLSQSGKVKIADFGVAAQLSNIKSVRNTFVGTPFWMAPEVIQEAGYDFKADIWSLGITAMEFALGFPPRADEQPMKVLFQIPKAPAPRLEGPQFSKEYKDFVASCLIKDPDRRPTARELLQHKFIKKAGKMEALRELIERLRTFEANEARPSGKEYYQETMKPMTPSSEEDDWVFDTIKPATIAQKPRRVSSQKRRKLTRIPSDEAADMVERLNLNETPLGTMSGNSPLPSSIRNPKARHSDAHQRRKSSALTAIRQPSTARRTPSAAQKEPLGLDMSFGNGTSTVRQFRRVSDSKSIPAPSIYEDDTAQKTSHHRSTQSMSSSTTLVNPLNFTIQHDENRPPTSHGTGSPTRIPSPQPLSKETLLARRAYTTAIDLAFQETHAQTANQMKREAIARIASAWQELDDVDPEGEFALLKAMMTRLSADKKLCATLLPQLQPLLLEAQAATKPPLTTTISSPNVLMARQDSGFELPPQQIKATSLSPSKMQNIPPGSYSPTKPSSPTKRQPNDDPFCTNPFTTNPTTPSRAPSTTSTNNTPKLILAHNNPHLKSHRRRQSTQVFELVKERVGSKEEKREEERRRESMYPGRVVPGLEHVGQLSDVLYGRWVEGLRGRWGI